MRRFLSGLRNLWTGTPPIHTILLRRGTEAEWMLSDRVLWDREPGVTTDSGGLKIGDGVTPWSRLPWTIRPSSPVPRWMTEGFRVRRVWR